MMGILENIQFKNITFDFSDKDQNTITEKDEKMILAARNEMQGRAGRKKSEIRKQRLDRLKENQLLVAEGRACLEHIQNIDIKPFLIVELAKDYRLTDKIHSLYRANQKECWMRAINDPMLQCSLFTSMPFEFADAAFELLGLVNIDEEGTINELTQHAEKTLFQYCNEQSETYCLSEISELDESSHLDTPLEMVYHATKYLIFSLYYAVKFNVTYQLDIELCLAVSTICGNIDMSFSMIPGKFRKALPPIYYCANKKVDWSALSSDDLDTFVWKKNKKNDLDKNDRTYLRRVYRNLVSQLNTKGINTGDELLTNLVALKSGGDQTNKDYSDYLKYAIYCNRNCEAGNIPMYYISLIDLSDNEVLSIIKEYLIVNDLYREKKNIEKMSDFMNYLFFVFLIKSFVRINDLDHNYYFEHRFENSDLLLKMKEEKIYSKENEKQDLLDQIAKLTEENQALNNAHLKSHAKIDQLEKSKSELEKNYNALSAQYRNLKKQYEKDSVELIKLQEKAGSQAADPLERLSFENPHDLRPGKAEIDEIYVDLKTDLVTTAKQLKKVKNKGSKKCMANHKAWETTTDLLQKCIETIDILNYLSKPPCYGSIRKDPVKDNFYIILESGKRSKVLTGDKTIPIEISLNVGDKKNWTDGWIVNKDGKICFKDSNKGNLMPLSSGLSVRFRTKLIKDDQERPLL